MKRIIVLLGLILLLVGCNNNYASVPTNQIADLQHSRTEMLMGGLIEITIFDIQCLGEDIEIKCSLLDAAFELVFDMEQRFTVNIDGGEVENINEMAGIQPVAVKADTFNLIEQAIYYSIYSEGLFNATVGPLTSMWNIGLPGTRRPSDIEIEAVLPLLDPTRVILDAVNGTVFLSDVGMRLDLGAIAKGYMADIVAEFFLDNGIERALVVIGGEVLAVGGRRDETPFRVGIRNPFVDDGSPANDYLVGSLPVYNQAAVTSGTYNRYLAHQDTRNFYHHIFDSRTGFPFESDIVSITVIADTGLLGEVYSTIVFAMGIEAGLTYVEANPAIEAMIISGDGGIYLSSGLAGFELRLEDEFEIRTLLTE